MSLFDTLASSLGQSTESGGQSSGLVSAALNFVNSQPGGLAGLIQNFHQAGAGDIVQSWIGNGENKAISPELLTTVLGSGAVSGLAAKFGLPGDQLAGMLAAVLPSMVDQATPNGELPASGQLEPSHVLGALGSLAAMFGKG